METETMGQHLDESALLHLVDEDASPLELHAWTSHVLACESCADRLRTRQRDTDRVRVAISEVQLPDDFPTVEGMIAAARARRESRSLPTAGRQRRWAGGPALRLAALVLLLLLPLAFVSPLRAALIEWVRQGWEQVVGDPAPSTADLPPAADQADSGYTLWFTPMGSEIEILIDQRQLAGELVVTRGEEVEASFEIEAGGGDAVLTDAGVRVRDNGPSRASYRLAVPASIDRVRVQVAGGGVELVERAQLQEGWSAELR